MTEPISSMHGDHQVVIIRPGTMLTDAEWGLAIDATARGYELDHDQVLVTPYGLAGMPRPPTANREDGSGRLWPDMNPIVAIHPVFWLPPHITAQRPGEDDDVYAVRLHLELVDRRMLDPSDQSVINPFLSHDLDVTHPEFQQDLIDYMAGHPVKWLSKFNVPDGRTASADIAEAAERLTLRFREAYYRMKHEFSARANDVVSVQRQLLDGADKNLDCDPVMTATEAYQANPSPQTSETLTQAVNDFLGLLDRYDAAGAVMVAAEQQATTGTTPALESQMEHLAEVSRQRGDWVRQALTIAQRDATKENLGKFWRAVTGAWGHVVAEGRANAQKAANARRELV